MFIQSQVKENRFVRGTKEFLSSEMFPFITAAVTLFGYYGGCELLVFYYIALTGSLILFLSDDLSQLVCILLFMCVGVSAVNSPSEAAGGSDYLFGPFVFPQLVFLIALFASSAVYRLASNCVKGGFRLNPTFFGLCALAVAFLLNGAFSKHYTPDNFLYGLIMAACFLGIFAAMKDGIGQSAQSFRLIALGLFAFSLLLVTELALKYAMTPDIIADGGIVREKLMFGWGSYNTYGVYIVTCLPAVTYLACISKRGELYTAYSFIVFAAAVFSCSRQTMLGAAVLFPVCLAVLLFVRRSKADAAIIAGAALVALIIFAVFFEPITNYLAPFFSSLTSSGNGRTPLFKASWKYFLSAPVFGAGFYSDVGYTTHSGLSFIPSMCHNTVLQLLGSCGVAGLAAYLVHRVQTIISFFRNVSAERTFIALCLCAIIGLSLVDNHIFNIFPTIIYSALTAVLIGSEKRKPKA